MEINVNKNSIQYLETNDFYNVYVSQDHRDSYQQNLITQCAEIEKQTGVNPMTSDYTVMAGYLDPSKLPGISDCSVNSHAEGINKSMCVFRDIESYFHGRFVTAPKGSKSWYMSCVTPLVTAVVTSLSAAWIEYDIDRTPALHRTLIALHSLRATAQHLQQCGLLKVPQFMTILSKINVLETIVRNWQVFIKQSGNRLFH